VTISCRSLWKKARKQIQQLKRLPTGSPEEFMIRYTDYPSMCSLTKGKIEVIENLLCTLDRRAQSIYDTILDYQMQN
jgi:hypothetical protein